MNQGYCSNGEWRAYVQYIEPNSRLGYCVLCPSTSHAEKTKQRMTDKGVFSVCHALHRGGDAVILNLIDYKPTLEELLLTNIYGQLAIANYAENWFSNEFALLIARFSPRGCPLWKKYVLTTKYFYQKKVFQKNRES